uniref:Uncharacterized protein n=1 Tax=Aegilops tauschii subsp. strangulata TaxID=200361 RepID=A0A452Z6F0_AEGTS
SMHLSYHRYSTRCICVHAHLYPFVTESSRRKLKKRESYTTSLAWLGPSRCKAHCPLQTKIWRALSLS